MTAAQARSPGGRRPIVAPWLRGYRRAWLGRDLVAGVVTACVVVPQCIAYAALAGLPVQVGLYVATVPMLAYALLGTSRPLSVSATSTLSILTAAAVADSGAEDPREAAAALAILVGGMLVLVGLLRLGFLADLVSAPILAGFKAGTGLVIISGQLGKVLGIPVGGTGFFPNLADVARGLDDISGRTVLLAAATGAVLLGLRHFAPRVPAPLVAVALGVVAVSVFDLADKGVAVVGAVPSGLPGFDVPGMDQWRLLAPGAAGIALMSAVESLAAARTLATRDDGEVDADRELVALGAANLGGGLFQAYPAGGGLSQSAVNDDAGARTQLSAITTVGAVLLVLTLLTGLLENLAQATLGALVIVAAAGLVKPAELRRLARVRVRDFGLAAVALAGVLVFGILEGVLIAVVVSLVVLLYQANRPAVEVVDAGAGLLALRPRGTLYFANVARVRDRIVAAVDAQAQPPKVVVVDVVAVPDLEVTALQVLVRLGEDLRTRGIAIWVAGIDRSQRDMFERFGPDSSTRLFDRLEDAVAAYESER